MKLTAEQIDALRDAVTGDENLEPIFKFATEVTVTGKVSLPKERYDQLVRAEDKLARLEAAGVDNWPGYSEALNMELED
jgi:hypothetical protein